MKPNYPDLMAYCSHETAIDDWAATHAPREMTEPVELFGWHWMDICCVKAYLWFLALLDLTVSRLLPVEMPFPIHVAMTADDRPCAISCDAAGNHFRPVSVLFRF